MIFLFKVGLVSELYFCNFALLTYLLYYCVCIHSLGYESIKNIQIP